MRKVTFISSRGRGMDTELKLVKDRIAQEEEKVSFQYFIKNEISKNKAYVQGLKSMKKDLIDSSDDVICMDMSINVNVNEMPENGKRILIMAPFNYLHEAMFQKQNNPDVPNKKGAVKFTHLYSTSPFNTELLQKTYNTEGVKIIEGFATPFSYYIADEQVQKQKREELEFYFPQVKGKKILSIMLRGAKAKEDWFLKEVDWNSLFESLDSDWVVATDSSEILNLLGTLPASVRDKFVYTYNLISGRDVCAIADILITNYGVYAGYMAARRKPFYTMPHNNSNYERYIKKNYPELSIDDEESLGHVIEHAAKHTDLHRKVSEYYSYAPDKDMIVDMIELLKEE